MAVVELNVGHDSFVAQALSDICRDEGIDSQLILATDPYVGMDHTTPHRLVVKADDVPAVEQIVADRFPDLQPANNATPRASDSPLARGDKPSLRERFLAWRRGDGLSRERSDESVPNKVAADEGDMIRHKHSNPGGGWGSNG